MEDKQGKVQMRQMNPIPFEMSSAAFSMSLCSRLSSQSQKLKLMFTVMVFDMIESLTCT